MHSDLPIDSHLFLSDLRTFALVDETGSVSWFCIPRLDGPPIFGALVGGVGAGHFRVAGDGPGRARYLGDSLVGTTAFGDIVVTDFLDCGGERHLQRAGRSDLVRLIEGRGTVQVEFAPKLDFGRLPTRLSGVEAGIRIDCGQHLMILHSPGWHWEISREGAHDVARATKTLDGESTALTLSIGTASPPPPSRRPADRRAATVRWWEEWAQQTQPPGIETELVRRSALVLRGLIFGPTGSIAAAGTTSLPESIGGVRNWDYRFCWPRDASMSASALVRLGITGPAIRLLDWLLGIVLDSNEGSFLAPLYTVTGRKVLGEAEVAEASGYRGSRPVRIGNLASEQLQLDTLGPIAELMLRLADFGEMLTGEHMQLSEQLVALVEARWNDPDSGIWEVRGAQRHFVHSKLMCWYTVTCCTTVSKYLGVLRPAWEDLAAEIRAQIEAEGWNEALNSYVAAYDLPSADGALLWVILSGFHPATHPRSLGTLDFVMKELVHDGAVYRYHFDDALHGTEGEFIICRAWLIEALARAGRGEEARALFREMIGRTGPLGLLAEQWDSDENCALGNYPQAYSHLGLINAACALDGR